MTPELHKLWRSVFPDTLILFIWPATYQEVRPAVAQYRAEAVVLDLETSGPDEVKRLHHDFPNLCIVGTHRLADDKLWAEALSLGASDICEPRNGDVVRSLLHGLTRHAAA